MAHVPDPSRPAPRRAAGTSGRKRAPIYAALDLGTNACRMLVAEPDGARFRVVDAFSKSVRLGEDLELSGALSPRAVSRTLQALQICAGKLRSSGVTRSRLVATEACRRARNGRGFLRQVRQQTGLALDVIEPKEEARLAVISCASLVAPEADQILIVDIGGGSTELVWIDVAHLRPEDRGRAVMRLDLSNRGGPGARVADWISVPLGVATLFQRFSDVEDDGARFALMSCFFEEQLPAFTPYLEDARARLAGPFQIIGTSGTITTVGAAHLGLRRYDRARVDGMRMTGAQIDAVIAEFLALGPEGRRTDARIGRDRVELIMSGAAILQTLLRIWPTDLLSVADRGLREGILYSMMSEDGALSG